MNVKKKKMNSKGLSLIEASMVLALSAIIISGVMVYYQSASESNKIKDAMILATGANVALQAAFANHKPTINNDGASFDALLFASSAIPDKFKDHSTKYITNPFGGSFEGMFGGFDDDDKKPLFVLSMTGVPINACQALVVMDIGDLHNKTAVSATGFTGPKVDKKLITPAKAADMCDTEAKKSVDGLVNIIYETTIG